MTRYRLPASGEKAAYVRRQFDRIAGRYDLLNDLISLGLHRGWKRATVKAALVRPGGRYLDLCSGTGDVALLAARAAGPGGRVVGLDYSAGMLAVASARTAARRGAAAGCAPVVLVRGDALRLPFAAESFDGVTVSFGLRNVADIEGALREAYRVLKRGARIAVVDTGVPPNPVYRLVADAFFIRAVPLIGALVARDREAYTYLPASREVFPSQARLVRLMADVGFAGTGYRNLAFGSAALHWGAKP